jgi:hypothetical protein
MDLDDVLQASENLNADINHGQLLPTITRDIVQVSGTNRGQVQRGGRGLFCSLRCCAL